ncbi:MAG: MEKHLA domain-containing protein [Nitrospirae bacterium]|nr:MEKHLA domain-containing protein [Nitrospirota bacterium]
MVITPFLNDHVACLLRSFRHWTGRDLLPTDGSPEELSRRLFRQPFVVISHGTEEDPILNYGNEAALSLWEMSWEEFTKTPSRLTAEPMNREERAKLLAEVAKKGFIDDYRGVRISKTGRRFRIDKAIGWNLIDEYGQYCGQAATFDRWTYL